GRRVQEGERRPWGCGDGDRGARVRAWWLISRSARRRQGRGVRGLRCARGVAPGGVVPAGSAPGGVRVVLVVGHVAYGSDPGRPARRTCRVARHNVADATRVPARLRVAIAGPARRPGWWRRR